MLVDFSRLRYSAKEYADAITNGNLVMLSKAITLIESNHPKDNHLAEEVLQHIFPLTGRSIRIGITGIPGAGKSSFIDAFGMHIITQGKKIAVLSIDPSSSNTHGSILGDKTRMENLAAQANTFIRPTAAGNTLGGVHSKTREAMLLCEAAGFDVIIIETVGVGQNETNIKNMVDFLLLMLIPGGGDELQGIKRGIVEAADTIIINKADGENKINAQLAMHQYENALHLLGNKKFNWQPRVITCSAKQQEGIAETWELVQQFKHCLEKNNDWLLQRQEQDVQWMKDIINHELQQLFKTNPHLQQQLQQNELAVRNRSLPAINAARNLLHEFIETGCKV